MNDELEELLAPKPKQTSITLKASKSARYDFRDFIDDNWQVIGGGILLVVIGGLSMPNILANQKQMSVLSQQMRPEAEAVKKQAALNAIAVKKNEIAEQRFGDPSIIPVISVRAGETPNLRNGKIASANIIVGDCEGLTGEVVPHPVKRFDAVTGAQIRRPIVANVYASRGDNYQKFAEKYCGGTQQ